MDIFREVEAFMLKKVTLFLLASGIVFSLANAHHGTSSYECSENSHNYSNHGYDDEGYDCEGYDYAGYDREGYDREGYDREGYDREGYNRPGYNREGYNRIGYDHHGFDRYGHNPYGEHYNPEWDYSDHEEGVSHGHDSASSSSSNRSSSRSSNNSSSRSSNSSSSRSSSSSNSRVSARNAEILAYAVVNNDVNSVDLLNELVSSRSLQNLGCSDLRILRNEVFARYGWKFGVNTELSNYFDHQNWYQVAYPRQSRTRNNNNVQQDVVENPIAMENIKIIQGAERNCY